MKEDLRIGIQHVFQGVVFAVEVLIVALTFGTSMGLFFGIPIVMIVAGVMTVYKFVLGG